MILVDRAEFMGMTRVSLAFAILFALIWTAACSGNGAGPDANSVQVNSGEPATVPNAEIPTEFTSADQALEWGKKLLDQGETERSIDVLLQAVKMNPDLAEAYFHLGIAYSLVEAEDQSVDRAEETPTPDRKSKKPQEEKKKNSEKAFESAVEAYKKILKNNEEDDVAHFYLGLTYNKLFEDEEAAKSLREAVKLKPDNAEYQTELGSILIKLAKYGEAVTALKKALELDPENIDAQELLEKAEAGKKRIEFDPPKKEEKDEIGKQRPGSAANSNASTSPNTKTGTSANADSRPSAKPARTPAAPARTPRP